MPRRSLAKASLWAAPTVVVSVSAPAFATSIRKDPGINWWVQVAAQYGGYGAWSSISVTSRVSGRGPDGAPFGLYLYDMEDVRSVSAAKLVYWVLGDHTGTGDTAITWRNGSGHSPCWVLKGSVGTASKPDGMVYTGYQWDYSCAIDPKATTTGSDGVPRVMLGDFVVATDRFRQPADVCPRMNFWAERSITLDGVPFTFQRRAGTDGPFSRNRRAARGAEEPVVTEGESAPQSL